MPNGSITHLKKCMYSALDDIKILSYNDPLFGNGVSTEVDIFHQPLQSYMASVTQIEVW